MAQAAVKRMLPRKHGAILFTGASASVKGYAQSASFAMGKFALRGLAQSLARELSPQGIHVAHFVIDGGIKSARRPADPDKPDALLDPDAIAASYLHVLGQAAQRLDAGTRAAAMDGKVLKEGLSSATRKPRSSRTGACSHSQSQNAVVITSSGESLRTSPWRWMIVTRQ